VSSRDDPGQGRLLRPDQVGDRLNISRSTVYRMISEGCFLVLKIRGSLRITERSLEEFIERQISVFAAENGESVSDVT
jgi:excisionase family DNA binding protein